MTPTLRTYHRVVWYSLALILPACFIAAVLSIPNTQINPRPLMDQPEALTRILKTAHGNQINVRIRTNATNTERQLEVIVERPLDVPEALVRYQCDTSESVLLGKLGQTGTYRFTLSQQISVDQCIIQFVNPFKQNVFDQISI